MTYKANIPQPTDRPSNSQNDFLVNFGQLNTIFKTNHYEYTYAAPASDRGKHRYVTYVNQLAIDPIVAGTEWASFVKNTTHPSAGTQSAPFIRDLTFVYNSPLVIEVADSAPFAGNIDVFNFVGRPSMIGVIYVYQSNDMSFTNGCQFGWTGAPTNSLRISAAQWPSGSTIDSITTNGATTLRVHTTANISIRVRIWATYL